MKGTTHLAIGAVIGAAANLFYPFELNHAALYLSVASFSALSADLDGPSLLIGKLSKLSKWLRELAIWGGVLLLAYVAYLYFSLGQFHIVFTAVAVTVSLLGFITKVGVLRNALVSLIGIGLLYSGYTSQTNWMMGLGLFILWAPWLNHRGLTHTVWALLAWGAIGRDLEQQLGIEGIMAVALAGYASHLVADTLTPNGVKWLYPLSKKSLKLPF